METQLEVLLPPEPPAATVLLITTRPLGAPVTGRKVVLQTIVGSLVALGHRVVAFGKPESDAALQDLGAHAVVWLLRCLPPVGDEAVVAARRLSAGNTLLVYLRVDRDDVSPWHYVTVYYESLVAVGRVTNVKVWRPGPFPAGSATIIRAELWTGGDTAVDALGDDGLAALAKTELDQVGLVPAQSVTDHFVVRLPRSVPVLRRGVRREMRTLGAAFSRFDGLEVIGRHGTSAWDGQEDALVQGALLADRFADEIADQTVRAQS